MNYDYEDELLVHELGSGGARARRLRKNVLELDLVVDMSPEAAGERVQQVLGEQARGRVLQVSNADETSAKRIIGMVGAGVANLNPAVVTVTIHPVEGRTRLLVRGAAKEGLIKQRAGQTAAKRVAAALAGSP